MSEQLTLNFEIKGYMETLEDLTKECFKDNPELIEKYLKRKFDPDLIRIDKKRQMPSKDKIKAFWAEDLVKIFRKFNSHEELYEADYCFSCGMLEKTSRCHIIPIVCNGSDNLDNLHLLCFKCHRISERMVQAKYYTWFYLNNLMLREVFFFTINKHNSFDDLLTLQIIMPILGLTGEQIKSLSKITDYKNN